MAAYLLRRATVSQTNTCVGMCAIGLGASLKEGLRAVISSPGKKRRRRRDYCDPGPSTAWSLGLWLDRAPDYRRYRAS